jgi:hypothetical protein
LTGVSDGEGLQHIFPRSIFMKCFLQSGIFKAFN